MPSDGPPPLASPQDPTTGPVETAAERVAARLPDLFPDGSRSDHDRLRRRLATLAVLLERSGEADRPRIALPADEGDPRLLEELSAELLWHSGGPVDAPGTLRALRACARYRSLLLANDSEATASEAEDLRARMSGANAFELLVEVAHDFRSPLTSVLFLSETLRDGHSGAVTDLQRSQLGLIYSAAFGLASVASDVVDLARENRGLVDDEPVPYSFAEVFRAVERMIYPMVEEKGLELRVAIPDRGSAEGHPHALTRVLLNLATNALKFTDQGFVELGVRPAPKGRIEFYVQDTGRGIPPERQGELFHPFKKRSGAQEGHFFSGSGIGLSIARRLVEAMGSTLEFTTSSRGGTRFHFALPASGRR